MSAAAFCEREAGPRVMTAPCRCGCGERVEAEWCDAAADAIDASIRDEHPFNCDCRGCALLSQIVAGAL